MTAPDHVELLRKRRAFLVDQMTAQPSERLAPATVVERELAALSWALRELGSRPGATAARTSSPLTVTCNDGEPVDQVVAVAFASDGYAVLDLGGDATFELPIADLRRIEATR